MWKEQRVYGKSHPRGFCRDPTFRKMGCVMANKQSQVLLLPPSSPHWLNLIRSQRIRKPVDKRPEGVSREESRFRETSFLFTKISNNAVYTL